MKTYQLPPEFFDFLKEMPAVIEAVKQIPMLVEAVKQIPVLAEEIKGIKADIRGMKKELDFNTVKMSQIQLDIYEVRDKVDMVHSQTAHYGKVRHVVDELKDQVTSTFDGFTQVLLDNKSKAV